MIRNTNLCIDLKTIMQEDAQLTLGQCYRGMLTRDSECHFLFEEAAAAGGRRCSRNPKLYDGKYISLVHMQNGRYQVHMRTIDASLADDRRDLAFRIYSELLGALEIME